MRQYRYHGIAVASPLELDLQEQPCPAAPHATTVVVRAEPGLEPPAAEPAWTSLITGYRLVADGPGRCWLAKEGSTFLLTPGEILLSPVPLDRDRSEYLATSVLSLWLQLTGRPGLHASAVELDRRAVGLVARSGGGKSTLASALVERGARLLCDDLVPVEFEGDEIPVGNGQPHIRLWPDSARRLRTDLESLPRVAPASEKRLVVVEDGRESARSDRPPLGRLYVLERHSAGDGPVTIDPLPAPQALMALLAHGQMAGPAETLGLGAARLQALSRVVRQVPVRRVRYPTAFESLPAVCEAIESDARP